MIHIVFYDIFIDYDLSGATGQPIEEGKTFTETQPHTKEDAVENEMVILPPLMEPENGKKEEGKGDADEEREEASKAEEMVENPFFNGLDEEGSKGLLIKREAEDQEAKEEAEESKEREEEERTRKEHEAEQRVEEEAERQAREREVSCLGIQQNRPSVIMAARSRKRAIEDETNNKDAALKLSDDDVSPAVLEKSEKEKGGREALGQASLDEARIAWILLGCLQMLSSKPSSEQDKEKATPANGHVATLATEERVKGIKEEITLDED